MLNFALTDVYRDRPQADAAPLVSKFTMQEAEATLKMMNYDSAPGPNGFGPSFFRAAWSTCQAKVMAFLTDFHSGVVELERINRAYIVLLPKKDVVVIANDYRPISLQNCAPKLASKIMTCRLQRQIA